MKLLFLLLLPACIQAQNFKIEQTNKCKCNEFNIDIYAVSLDSAVGVYFRILDELYPRDGDSIYYNGKVWKWHKKQLHLYGNVEWSKLKPEIQETSSQQKIDSDRTMRAYSPAGNFIESTDSNHFKVYYLKTETVKPHSTASGNSVPIKPMLYVIDGFETYNKKEAEALVDGKLLVSTKIYKGMDATATKYGAKASGGVTIITTYKKHK